MEVDENVRKTFEGLKKRIVGIDKLTERQEKNERKIQKLEAEKITARQEVEKQKGETDEVKQELENERKEHEKFKTEANERLEEIKKDKEAKVAEVESLIANIENLKNNASHNDSLIWELKAEVSTLKQQIAASEEEYALKNVALKQLKQKQTMYEAELKEKEKKIKTFETIETEKDKVIEKSLARDKKLQKALDDVKRISREKEELKRVVVELKRDKQELKRQIESPKKVPDVKIVNESQVVNVNEVQVIHETPALKEAQNVESDDDVAIVAEKTASKINPEFPVGSKKKKGIIFGMFNKLKKSKSTKVVRRKIKFVKLHKITPNSMPEALEAQPAKRVPGVDSNLNLEGPSFDFLGNRYHVPRFQSDGNPVLPPKSEDENITVMSNTSTASNNSTTSTPTRGPKRKVVIESPTRHTKKPKLAPFPEHAPRDGPSLPKEISPIKSPARLPRLGKVPSVQKTPNSSALVTQSPSSSTPVDHSTPSPKPAKKQVAPKPSRIQPANTEETEALPKILSPNFNTARSRIVSTFNPNPAAIDPVKSGSRLTAAQKEAAKMRMVGRAAPGVATRPSVNGFRATEPQTSNVKTNKLKSEEQANVKVKGLKSRNKTTGIESLLETCPTRKSTQPSKINSGGRRKSTVEETQESVSQQEVETTDDPKTPTGDSNKRNRRPNHETPRQESTPIGDFIQVSSEPMKKAMSDKAEERLDSLFGDVEKSPKVVSKSNLGEEVIEAVKVQVVKSPEKETSAIVTESSVEMQCELRDRQDSVESLEDDLNLSDTGSLEDDGDQEEQCEHEVSMKSPDMQDEESDGEDDKPVNRRKRKFSEIDSEKDKNIEVMNVHYKEEDVNEGQAPKLKAAETPKCLLEELLDNVQQRQEDKLEKLKLERENFAKEKASFARETFLQCLRNNIANYNNETQTPASFVKIIDGISTGNIESDQEAICDLVFEEIRNQSNEELTLDQTCGGPPITRLEKRLFVLLDALQKKKRFDGIMLRMGNLLSDGLFGKNHMYSLKMNIICSFTRMFVLCMRRLNKIDRVKGLILDLLYFKSPRNHLIISICQTLFPSIFHHYTDLARDNPVEKTVAWMIFNTGVQASEMSVNEVRSTFRNSYGYPISMGVRAADLVKEFIKLATEKTQTVFLRQLSQCLQLIGRAHDYSWVNNNIVSRLAKLLQNVQQGTYPNDQGEILRIWVLKTFGSLARQFTVVEGNKDRALMVESYDGIIGMMKINRKDMSADLENAAVSALVDYGHHLQIQIADFFTTFKPKHQLWPETITKLEDFFGTRGRKYAEITCERVKNEKRKETKWKIRKQIAEFRQSEGKSEGRKQVKEPEQAEEKSSPQNEENSSISKDNS